MANKLGSETGSVTNHLLSGHLGGPAPVVGMGVTFLHWTDRSAGTVVWVSPSGKTIKVREDRATPVGPIHFTERQTYTYAPDPLSPVQIFRLTARGWRRKGTSLHLGERSAYRDPSF